MKPSKPTDNNVLSVAELDQGDELPRSLETSGKVQTFLKKMYGSVANRYKALEGPSREGMPLNRPPFNEQLEQLENAGIPAPTAVEQDALQAEHDEIPHSEVQDNNDGHMDYEIHPFVTRRSAQQILPKDACLFVAKYVIQTLSLLTR